MKPISESRDTLMQVSLSPETKYFAVLLSKRAGLSLSEFVNECVHAVLSTSEVQVDGKSLDYDALKGLLWAEHPADRFALLATHFPGELTVREELLWLGIVKQSPEFWTVPPIQLFRTDDLMSVIKLKELRKQWDEFEGMNRDAIAARAQEIKRSSAAAFDRKLAPELKQLRDTLRAQLANKNNVTAVEKGKKK